MHLTNFLNSKMRDAMLCTTMFTSWMLQKQNEDRARFIIVMSKMTRIGNTDGPNEVDAGGADEGSDTGSDATA